MTPEGLEKIIQEKVSEAIKNAAGEIIEQAKTIYDLTVDRFYSDYDPRKYVRSYGIYNAAEEYYVDLGDGFEAGIKTNPSNIGSYYHDPADYVFNGAFGLGFHGTSDIWVTEPSSDQFMRKWRRAYYKKIPGILRKYVSAISL
jgi:hypothetical protein